MDDLNLLPGVRAGGRMSEQDTIRDALDELMKYGHSGLFIEGVAALDSMVTQLREASRLAGVETQRVTELEARLAEAERERDSARRGRGAWEQAHDKVNSLRADAEARLAEAERERDEWKAKYEARAEAYPTDVEFYGR